jgi:hypothetical protein
MMLGGGELDDVGRSQTMLGSGELDDARQWQAFMDKFVPHLDTVGSSGVGQNMRRRMEP